MKQLFIAFLIATIPAIASAEGLVTKTSPHDVKTTVDKLAAAVEAAGAKVFARVDHAAGAEKVGEKLRPTEMLMFGNPKIGTPALLLAQTAGLDLPLRVVVFENDKGETVLAYHDPIELSKDHGVPPAAEVLTKMAGALKKLTDKAIAK